MLKLKFVVFSSESHEKTVSVTEPPPSMIKELDTREYVCIQE